jgi:hypothetical protein
MFFNAYRHWVTGLYEVFLGPRRIQSGIAQIPCVKCGATDKKRLTCKVGESEWTCSTCDGLDWEDDE